MTFSGCVLPLSPTWEDPAKETNYAPQVVGTVPVEGFVLPQTVIQIQDDRVIEVFTDKFVNQPLYPVPAWDKRS